MHRSRAQSQAEMLLNLPNPDPGKARLTLRQGKAGNQQLHPHLSKRELGQGRKAEEQKSRRLTLIIIITLPLPSLYFWILPLP